MREGYQTSVVQRCARVGGPLNVGGGAQEGAGRSRARAGEHLSEAEVEKEL